MSGVGDRETPQDCDQQASEDTPSADGNNGPRQVKKRNRIPVSCSECRRRKLRYVSFEYIPDMRV